MRYLMIRSPGVCDYRALVMMGVSSSRGNADKIGQFGSGFKYSIALCLNKGISVNVFSGLTKMDFYHKEINIDNRKHHQICVDLSGKIDGKPVKRTEELSYTLGMGELGWTDISMVLREIVSNARDSSVENNKDISDIEIVIVPEEKVRAKDGYTSVFLGLTDLLEDCYQNELPRMFLNRSIKELENVVILRKPKPSPLVVYKKGVRCYETDTLSLFNYNFNDLDIDESRNANVGNVDYYIGHALHHYTTVGDIDYLFRETANNPGLYHESDCSIRFSRYDEDYEYKEKLKAKFKAAIGPDKVAYNNMAFLNYIQNKGLIPYYVCNPQWIDFLTWIGIATTHNQLSKQEMKCREIKPAKKGQEDVLNNLWERFESIGVTKNVKKPELKSYFSSVAGGCQDLGEYEKDSHTIFILESLDEGLELKKTMIEELIHALSGASDFSRDYQAFSNDIIARLI